MGHPNGRIAITCFCAKERDFGALNFQKLVFRQRIAHKKGAINSVRHGVDLRRLQQVLGHSNISTWQGT